VITAPFSEYIEEWVKKAIINIIEGPIEVVNIGHIKKTKKYTKDASTSK